jgi:hypothetical protein
MENLAVSVFPTDAVTTITSGVTTAISDNIAVVIGVLAFFVGLRVVFALFNKQVNKRVG